MENQSFALWINDKVRSSKCQNKWVKHHRSTFSHILYENIEYEIRHIFSRGKLTRILNKSCEYKVLNFRWTGKLIPFSPINMQTLIELWNKQKWQFRFTKPPKPQKAQNCNVKINPIPSTFLQLFARTFQIDSYRSPSTRTIFHRPKIHPEKRDPKHPQFAA